MNDVKKIQDFMNWVDDVLNSKPGMLGSISDISAMFYIIDNINNILHKDERLPRELSWNEFLISKNLFRNLKSVPVEEGWDYDRFVDLRRQYVEWLGVQRENF